MTKYLLNAMAVTLVLWVTALFMPLNITAADTEDINTGLAKLKWGMSLDETENAMGVSPDSTEEVESAELRQTLLTYKDVIFKGYDAYVILCVTEENGLEGVNFHIVDELAEAGEFSEYAADVHSEFYEYLRTECAEYEVIDSTFSFWHFDDENYTVMLFDLYSEIQFSYFPLFSEEDRGETLDGGEDYISYLGNSNTAAYDSLINLKWGMSCEEAEKQMAVEPDAVEIHNNGEYSFTYYYYDEVAFRGYNGCLLLVFTDGIGLDGVNFYLDAEIEEDIYKAFKEELTESCTEYGMYENSYTETYFYFGEENFDVMLCDLVTEVQFSFFPSFAEDEKVPVLKGGGLGYGNVQTASPETGNTGLMVYFGIVLLSGTASMVTRKRR